MPLPDNAIEKWEYKKHTEVKHEILGKYLSGWIKILGSSRGKVCYFDCFAGRGEYTDGALGSPMRALDIATRLENYYEEFVSTFVENDDDNFQNLMQLISKKKNSSEISKKIEVIPINDEFANVASKIVDDVGSRLAPSFFFIDPFGFSGVPFELIKRLLSIQRVEVFLTFMSRDINRFLDSPKHEHVLDQLFGTEKWREISKKYSGIKRQFALRDLYITQLIEEVGVKHVWPYEVGMDEIHQTVYQLIHATNHFKGFRLMKQIQFNASIEEGIFGYRGPEETQQMLFSVDDDLAPLRKLLIEAFQGERKTFYQVQLETFHKTPLIEKHYREVLRELETEQKVTIDRRPKYSPSGKIRTAIDDKCYVTFH